MKFIKQFFINRRIASFKKDISILYSIAYDYPFLKTECHRQITELNKDIQKLKSG